MFHVHSSCISQYEEHKRQYLTKESVSSKYGVENESKRVMLMIFSIE